jgi:invasion protein IalB
MQRMAMTAWTVLTFGALAGPAATQAQEKIGDFFLFERVDPTSGGDRNSITTLADENYISGAGGLTLRCAEDGLEMVVTATYLGNRTDSPIQYSFDDGEPRSANWTVRSTGMAAIAPTDVRDDFVGRAVAESSVVVQVHDFQLRAHTYTFRLAGLQEALARLGCH